MAISMREAISEISSLYREGVIANLQSLLQAELPKPISKDQQEKRDALINFCLQRLENMSLKLKSFNWNLEKNLDTVIIIQKNCDYLLDDYNAIIAAFESLEKIHEFPHDSPLIVAPFRLLGLHIDTIKNFFASQPDLSADESMDESTDESTNGDIFSMGLSDDSPDSKYSDSSALSTADSAPQRPEDSDKKEKTKIYTPFSSRGTISESSSSKVEPPKRALSAQRQDSASPKEEKPQDAIRILSEMLRQAKYLRDAIWFLCYRYKSFHPSVEDEHDEDKHDEDEHDEDKYNEDKYNEDEHYKLIKSKLDGLSSRIENLEMNLKIRTAGHIRSAPDCSNYERDLKSIIRKMKVLIQNPDLKKEMDFIYDFIRSRPVNHNTKLKHHEIEVYYTTYINKKQVLSNLCTEVGKPKGIVRTDIARIRAETNGKIIVDDVFAVELEMESTPSYSETEESSSQLLYPQETTSDEKKTEENHAGAYPDSITPLPSIGHNLASISFFKEPLEEEVDFSSKLKIIESSQPPEEVLENHQEEQKDTVNSNQNSSGQNGLIYRSLSFSRK